MSRILMIAAISACTVSCTANYVKTDAALGRVVIYRNGVAFFERQATVTGDELTLSVPRDKVDDFLKSLTVKDAETEKPLPISFPSSGNETGGVVEMVVRLPKKRSAKVILTYITEAPAWKPSYRVVVGDDGKVHLQSWAIVDNTSGEDWKDVLVGVGSSSALSFRYDLWSIRNVQRRTLASQDRFAIAPPTGSSPYRGGREDVVLGELSDDDIPRSTANASGHEQIVVTGERAQPIDARPPSPNFGGDGGRGAHGDYTTATKSARPPPQRQSEAKRRAEVLAAKQSARRQHRNRENVAKLAEKLKAGNRRVVIEGYAGRGEANADQRSLQRANTLRNQLIANGVAPALVDVRAGGAEDGRPAGVRLLLDGPPGNKSEPTAPGTPVGESHFESGTPMSVERGESVMVSIVDDETDGEQVYLYDAESSRGNARYAFKAVRLVNPTDNALETGPVTVFGNKKFIGEGLIDPIPPHATALIPFALDRQIVVERKTDSRDQISRLVSLSRGVLTTEVQHVRRSKLEITNRLKEPTTVYVKHTIADGWKLDKAPKRRERLGEAHLFAVALGANSTKTIEIEETTPLTKTLDIRTPAALEMFRVYLASAKDPELDAQIKNLLAIHKQMADHQQAIESLHDRLADYRVRMDELHLQIVSLKAVKSGGALMRDLKKKMRQISDHVQQATLDVVSRQEKLMLARIRFQDTVAELTLEREQVATK